MTARSTRGHIHLARALTGAAVAVLGVTALAASPDLAGATAAAAPAVGTRADAHTAAYEVRHTGSSGTYATITFARGDLQASSSAAGATCKPLPGAYTLLQAESYLTNLGVVGETDVSPAMIAQSTNACADDNYLLSWDQLQQLSAAGWGVTVRGNESDAKLPPAQQYADSCGLLPLFSAEGIPDASADYAYNGGPVVASMQSSIVSQCYSFGRQYLDAVNTLPITAPYVAAQFNLNGGSCNDKALSCYNGSAPLQYTLPSQLEALLTTPGWLSIQTYKLVTGAYHSSANSWDCTSADPTAHWTSQSELYCANDWQAVASAVAASATVVTSAQMAQMAGRTLRGPVTSMTITPPATALTGLPATFAVEGYDAAGDDLGNVASTTTLTISPAGSCSGATCTAPGAGLYTVQASNGAATTSTTVTVSDPGPVASLAVTTTSPTIAAGVGADFRVEGYDAAGDDLGDVTASSTLGIAGPGTCVGASCQSATPGTYTVTASDGAAAGSASLTVVSDPPAAKPTITSGYTASMGAWTPGSATITTTGWPYATVSVSGVPTWLTLTPNGDGTATLTGTPPSGGQFVLSITASNSAGHMTRQLTIDVGLPPVVTSPTHAKGKAGTALTIAVTGKGNPAPTLTASGLPTWLTLTATVNGRAALKGTPPAGSAGTYRIGITATNSYGSASQILVLTIS